MISSSGSHSLYELTGQLKSVVPDENRTERRTILSHEICGRISDDIKKQARRAMTTRTVLEDKHKAPRAMTTRTVLQDKHSQTIFQIDTHNTHTLIFNTYRHHNPV